MNEQPPSPPAPPIFTAGQVQLLVDLLQICRQQFQLYGDLHVAKSPPQLEKAHVNFVLVDRINRALIEHHQTTVQDMLSSWKDNPVGSPDNNPEATPA